MKQKRHFMGGLARNRLSRQERLHSIGGRASSLICGLAQTPRQYHAFLCRPACFAPLTATAIGPHAGTGRGRPPAGASRVPDLFQRDHVRSPASEPANALIAAEKAQADRRPRGLHKDSSTPSEAHSVPNACSFPSRRPKSSLTISLISR